MNFPGSVRSLFLLLAVLLAASVVQAQDEENPIVIRYGDYVERLSDLDERFEIAIRGVAVSEGVELTETLRAQLTRFKPSFLEQRATEVFLITEAAERGIEVSEEEIDAQIASVEAALPEGDTLEALMERAGFRDQAQLRVLVRETEQIQRALDAIEADIEISDADVEEFYSANQALFNQPEQVCARHLVVTTSDEAQSLLDQIEGGVDFAALANEHSLDEGAADGDLGCFPRGVMVEPFEEAAFGAEADTTVGPVETQFGFHLIQVYDRTPTGPAPLERVREEIESQLRAERLPATLSSLVEEAGIETFPDELGVPAEPEAPAEGQ